MAASTMASKGKCEEEEDDRISGLPDCLIEEILSFLPSTKDAIRTGVLSKRWLNQWTYVPILIFKSNNGTSKKNFSNFIDNALNVYNNCSKINKFVIDSNNFCLDKLRRKLGSWIRFAAARDVKEVILNCDTATVEVYDLLEQYYQYHLPQFLFNNAAFLVKLKTNCCLFRPEKGNVNWTSLKALYIGFAYLTNQGIGNVISGTPVIEYLELCNCYGFQHTDEIPVISIASKSLKTFRIFESDCSAIEISCPNLEKLELVGNMWITYLDFDLPPSVSATLNFKIGDYDCTDAEKVERVEEFLLQVQHVEDLKLGACFLRILSLDAVGAESSLLLNNKCLTVLGHFPLVRQLGLPISYLRFSSLEKLVINLYPDDHTHIPNFMEIEKKFSELDWSVFDNLVSNLKTVEIVGLAFRSHHDGYNDVLKFVTFLLKNARMLEKMVLLDYPGVLEMNFAHKVCKELSCIQKNSPHAIVKVERLSMFDLDSNSDWDNIIC